MTTPSLTPILRNQTVSATSVYELQRFVKWLRDDNFAAPTTALTVASVNGAGAAETYARSDHSHAVTVSSNPGAAAAILASNADGGLELQQLGVSSHYEVDGLQVVGSQGAAVADATDAASVILRLNDLLARLRTHGLIAT